MLKGYLDRPDSATRPIIRVYIAREDRGVSLREGVDKNHNLRRKFLQDLIPGFIPGKVQALAVVIHRKNKLLKSYHVYNGGPAFGPTLPKKHARGGDVLPVSFDLLPLESFVKSLPRFQMTNVRNLNWLANEAIVTCSSLVGDELTIDVIQDCPFNDIGEFRLKGTVSRFPGSSPRYGGIFLQFRISDYIGRTSELRIQFDGFSSPTLQILRRGSFYKANLISCDGFRLSVLYSSGNFAATIYLKAPSSEIYALADMKPLSGHHLQQLEGRHSSAFRIDSIALLRNLERNILGHRFEYDVGRLGAEIAYMIATEKLRLQNVVIQEPSAGGRDLYTLDNTVSIQTRFLVNLDETTRDSTVQDVLLSLVKKLQEDYANQDQMRRGYAILTYLERDSSVGSIILEVPRQRIA